MMFDCEQVSYWQYSRYLLSADPSIAWWTEDIPFRNDWNNRNTLHWRRQLLGKTSYDQVNHKHVHYSGIWLVIVNPEGLHSRIAGDMHWIEISVVGIANKCVEWVEGKAIAWGNCEVRNEFSFVLVLTHFSNYRKEKIIVWSSGECCFQAARIAYQQYWYL